jgi:hypothetical protein
MSDPTQCSECRAILEELRRTGMRVPHPAMDEGIRKMMMGSEEGVDDLLARFPFRPQRTESLKPSYVYPRFGNLFRKILDHKSRTGHNPMNLFRR